MNRALLLPTVILLVASSGAFGFDVGVGAQYSATPQWAVVEVLLPGAGVAWAGLGNFEEITLRAWPYSVELDIGAIYTIGSAGSGYWNLGLTADWWMLERRIGKTRFGFYLGAGLGLTFPAVGASVRLPAGLRWWPVDKVNLETYVELVPFVGYILAPLTLPVLGGQLGIGARYWFTIRD